MDTRTDYQARDKIKASIGGFPAGSTLVSLTAKQFRHFCQWSLANDYVDISAARFTLAENMKRVEQGLFAIGLTLLLAWAGMRRFEASVHSAVTEGHNASCFVEAETGSFRFGSIRGLTRTPDSNSLYA